MTEQLILAREQQPASLAETIETRKLEKIIGGYQKTSGTYDIVPVQQDGRNIGYLLQSHRNPAVPGNDRVYFDYDHTLVHLDEARERRLDQYKMYAEKLAIDATDAELATAMKITDTFARFGVLPHGAESYTPYVHTAALAWVTEQMKQTDEDAPEKPTSQTDGLVDPTLIEENPEIGKYRNVLLQANSDLYRIKHQLPGKDKDGHVHEGRDTRQEGDPFFFRQDGKLVTGKHPWTKQLEDIFLNTISTPEPCGETVEAALKLQDGQGVDTGIFTRGHTDNQLTKVLRLIERRPDLAPRQILLSKINKGPFLKALAQRHTERGLNDLVDPLSDDPHAVVVVDDSVKELQSLTDVRAEVAKVSGASVAVVRSIRPGTKTGKPSWTAESPHEVLDFGEPLTGDEARKTILRSAHTAARSAQSPERTGAQIAQSPWGIVAPHGHTEFAGLRPQKLHEIFQDSAAYPVHATQRATHN